LFTVALTLTVSARCAGEVTVHVVATVGFETFQDVQLTAVALAAPNLIVVWPLTNPVPVIVTVSPPALEPLLGLTPLIVGVNVKRSAVEMAVVPPAVVALTSTTPAGCAGDTAVSDVGELTVTLAAGVVPKLTAVVAVKFAPVIVTAVPPPTGPIFGFTFVRVGAATYVN
jgi:hypothetical protein